MIGSFIEFGGKRVQLRLAGEDYDEDNFGEYRHKSNEILISPHAAGDPDILGDTILHEFVHLVFATRGVSLKIDAETEEIIATVLGDAFYELVVRNPKLVKHIMKMKGKTDDVRN